MALDTQAARTDLTDRECAKILGGLLGSLIQMAPAETVRQAVRWWAESDEAWTWLTSELSAVHAKVGPGAN